ncbi:bacteriohemerythrin [Desulfosediminicola flagellatus]|uniref:bacteriohemerythrin n=1 Tax=Desulfosediminicola flagellatus TaxID=2569541 RepID=UPI0010AD5A3F|nr:bacteriohemerythrin [Desulfosediminicola flagellatus]
MAVIKWRDSYNTGVEQFDTEHHKIVDLIEVLFLAVRNRNDSEVEKAINELIGYTEKHFAAEELMMENAGFPELEQHKKEHVRLARQAKDFQEIQHGEMSYAQVREFYHFLREWLVDHIVGCDKKYGEFMADRPSE